MRPMLNPSAKYTEGLSYEHTKKMNKLDRHRCTTYGYSLRVSVRFGIPVSNQEVLDQSYVRVSDFENKMYELYNKGFDVKIYEDGSVRYNFTDIKPYLPDKEVTRLGVELRSLRSQYCKKYKEYYRKIKNKKTN